MQAVEIYMPSFPNLQLTPFQSTNTITNDVNPLNYHLTPDDFITLALPNGQLIYALDPATGTLLWWALHRIARVITRAATQLIPFDPSLPTVQCAYIPQFQFDRIGMLRPAILSTLDSDCMNPLYGYTTRENVQAWYNDFQSMGRQAVQWIRTARDQSAHYGVYSGWNWDTFNQDGAVLEFPDRYLVKGPEGAQSFVEFFLLLTDGKGTFNSTSYVVPPVYSPATSDLSSEASNEIGTQDGDVIMDEAEYSKQPEHSSRELKLKDSPDNGCLVLHLLLSAYAKRHPEYDVFSKEPLIDNGYVEREAGDLTPYTSMLSPIASTTFLILSLPGTRND